MKNLTAQVVAILGPIATLTLLIMVIAPTFRSTAPMIGSAAISAIWVCWLLIEEERRYMRRKRRSGARRYESDRAVEERRERRAA